ncbi:hypothetical protein [Bdellovibrio sp.]|uniref:hypothetical protein n=1 Tax=Bdellovibrio sp. TaxID=28201 RepID=UPI0039E298DD
MSLMASTLLVTCLAYGPAVTRENNLKYKFLQPIEIANSEIRTVSVNQNSEFEVVEAVLTEDRSDACPGTISGKQKNGAIVALKGLYTGPNGYTRGVFIFDDLHGERYKALVECPHFAVNPSCPSDDDAIHGWESF